MSCRRSASVRKSWDSPTDTSGSADPSSHETTTRGRMPGARGRSRTPYDSTRADTGRSARSVSRYVRVDVMSPPSVIPMATRATSTIPTSNVTWSSANVTAASSHTAPGGTSSVCGSRSIASTSRGAGARPSFAHADARTIRRDSSAPTTTPMTDMKTTNTTTANDVISACRSAETVGGNGDTYAR